MRSAVRSFGFTTVAPNEALRSQSREFLEWPMFPQKEHLTLFFFGRPVVGAAGAEAAVLVGAAAGAAAAAAAGGGDDSATVALRFFFCFSVADRILSRLLYTRNMLTFGGPDVEEVEELLVQSTTVPHQLATESVELLLLQTLRLQARLLTPLNRSRLDSCSPEFGIHTA